MTITTPPASTLPPSALEGLLNRSISPRQPAPAAVRKLHLRALDSAIEVLQSACEISTPAIKDEYANEPIEKQRLLSPTSENKVVTVQQWRRPALDDTALDLLMSDVELPCAASSALSIACSTPSSTSRLFDRNGKSVVEAALAALSEAEEGTGSSQGSSASASDSGAEEVVDEAERSDRDNTEEAGEARLQQGDEPQPLVSLWQRMTTPHWRAWLQQLASPIAMQRGTSSNKGLSSEGAPVSSSLGLSSRASRGPVLSMHSKPSHSRLHLRFLPAPLMTKPKRDRKRGRKRKMACCRVRCCWSKTIEISLFLLPPCSQRWVVTHLTKTTFQPSTTRWAAQRIWHPSRSRAAMQHWRRLHPPIW